MILAQDAEGGRSHIQGQPGLHSETVYQQNETTLPPINPKKIELSIFLYNFLYLQSTSSKFVILYTGTTLLILIIRSGNGYPKGTLGASIWKRNG
jgi:hypothetical protein